MPTEIKKLDLASIKTTSSSDNSVLVVNNGEVAFADELFVSGLNVTGDFNISGRIFQSGEPFVGGGGGDDLTSVTTNVVPVGSGTLDLGTASKPWRDLYITTGTIYLGEETIKVEDQKIVFSRDIRVKHDGVNLKRLVRENETGIFAESANLEKTDANLAATGENLLGQILSNDSDLSSVTSNLVSTGQNLQANISTNVGAIATNVSDISSNTANLAATGQTLQQEKLNVMGGTISGEILPYESGAVNLGSPLLPFRSGYFDDLIVSADSIQIGPDTTLSATAEGGMSFDTVGTITFGDVVVTGDLGVSGDFTLGDTTTDRITTRGDLFVLDDAFFADAVEITGSLTVDGTASAATPTQNSHLTTKLYVDTDIITVSGLITNNDTELNDIRTATGALKTSTDTNASNLVATGQTLQTQITSNDSDISTLTTNLISTGQSVTSEIAIVSGLITSNDTDLSNLRTATGSLQTQVTSNDSDITSLTTNLITTGQTLQTQITSNDSDVSTLTSNLINTGQSITSEIAIVSGLTTSNDTDIAALTANIGTTGQTLQTQITSNDGDITSLTSNLVTTGQTLQAQITSNDSDISTLTTNLISTGQTLQTQITSNDSDIATLTTNLTATGSNLQAQVASLSGDAVLLAGDQTVAGNKTFSNDVTVLGDLAVSGDFTLGDATTDRITTRGDLYVEDDAVFQDDITVTGDAHFAGSVGIGTAAPAEILEVVSDSDPTILIRPVTVDSANSGKISYRENAGGTTGVDLRYDGNVNKFIIDTSDVSNALVIQRTDGNVGIGTTAPGAKLHVSASNTSAAIYADQASSGYIFIGRQSTANRFRITNKGATLINTDYNNNGTSLVVTHGGGSSSYAATFNGGKVGIGTTSPSYSLHVVGDGYFSNDLSLATGKTFDIGTITRLTDNGSSYIGGGNFGIGTAAPTRLLTLENNTGTVINESQLRINNAGAGDAYVYMYAGADWSFGIDNSDADKFKFNISNDVSDGTEVLTLQRDGKVGIGITSPTSTLHVVGTALVTSTANFNGSYTNFGGGSGGSGASIESNGRITTDYRIGIGTTTPSVQLQTTGDVIVGGNLTVSGTTFTVDTSNVLVEDPVLLLAKNQTGGAALDAGFLIERGTDTNVGFIWDESADRFAVINTTEIADDNDITIASYAAFKAATVATNTGGGDAVLGSHLDLGDNQKARFGAGDDLQIYHDGSHSYIRDAGTGNLNIRGDGYVYIQSQTGGNSLAHFHADAEVGLYYNNSLKLETTSIGVEIAGSLGLTGHITKSSGTLNINASNLALNNAAETKTYLLGTDGGSVQLRHNDSTKLETNSGGVTVTGTAILGGASFIDNATAYFGTGNDLRILHDGADSVIDNLTGDLYITNKADDKNIIFRSDDGVGGYAEYFRVDGAEGRTVFSKYARFIDDAKLMIGTGADLQIYHSSSDNHSYIKESGTGHLYIQATNLRLQSATGENFLEGVQDGAVNLYYDDVKKLATTSTGVDVTGVLKASTTGTDVYPLRVSNTNTAAATQTSVGIEFQHNGGTGLARIRSREIDVQDNFADLIFDVAGGVAGAPIEAMRILADGKVGIGTTSPNSPLTVAGSTSPHIELRNDGTVTNGTEIGRLFANNGAGNFLAGFKFIYKDSNNGEIRIRQKVAGTNTDTVTFTEGKVGIGTTAPEVQLHIDTTAPWIRSEHSTSGDYLQLGHNGSAAYVDFSADDLIFRSASNTERVRIKSDGKVGIGTTTPIAKLETRGADQTKQLVISNSTYESGPSLYANETGIWFKGNYSTDDERAKAAIILKGTADYGVGDLVFAIDSGATNDNATLADEKMRITSAGNVGIGTSSPGVKLDVVGTIQGQKFQFNDDTNTSIDTFAADQIGFKLGANNSVKWAFVAGAYGMQFMYGSGTASYPSYTWNGDSDTGIFNATTNALGFTTGGTERVRIAADGNVGIGTTAPAGKLEVYGGDLYLRGGDINLRDGTGVSGSCTLEYNSATGTMRFDRPLYVSSSDDNYFAGNVGIGTSAPLELLHVQGTSNASDVSIRIKNLGTSNGTQANLDFHYSTADRVGGRISCYLDDTSSNSTSMRFSTRVSNSSGERMRIASDGKVGIGTAAPAAQLMVSEAVPPGTQIGGSNTLKLAAVSSNAVGRRMEIGFDQFYGSTYSHSVIGQIVTSRTSFETGDLYFATKDGTTNVAPTERMRITSNGNVGIGTSTPAEKLEVAGNIKLADNNKILLGTGNDLQLYHDGTDSFITNSTGYLAIKNQVANGYTYLHGDTVHLRTHTGNEPLLTAVKDGAVSLYYDNAVKLATTTNGVNVTGTLQADNLTMLDNEYIRLGNSNDLQIFHDGSHSYIKDTGTGNLVFNGSQIWLKNAANSANMIGAVEGSYVKLFHNNNERFVTTSTGAAVTGDLLVTGQLSATTKSFLIDHPTKPGKKLRHGSLEGPENGVYIRGRGDNNIITLPEYWTELVDKDSITVQLTPIGKHQHIYVEKIDNNTVYIQSDEKRKNSNDLNYFYLILAERKDVDKLVIEE